jgi:hypothetical protein
VFLCDASRPAAGEQILQRLGFARTTKRIAQDRFDNFRYPDGCPAMIADPIAQVFAYFEWKPATRSTFRVTKDVPPQMRHCARLGASSPGAAQSGQQALGVARGTQQVSGFNKPRQFSRRNEGNIALSPFRAHNHDFLLIDYLVQNAREILAKAV